MTKFKVFWVSAIAAAALSLMVVSAMAQTVNLNLFYDGENHTYSAGAVSITVDGNPITDLDMPPVILNDRTLIPARAVFEAIGAEVTWNPDTKEVYITDSNNIVVLAIDKTTAYKNGDEIVMDVAPKIINDRTMIPIRYAAVAMDCGVTWDKDTRTVIVESKEYASPEAPSQNHEPVTPSGSSVKITGVVLPDANAAHQDFLIKADGEIPRYEEFVLTNDRLVLDIYGAESALSNENITVSSSPVVKAVRSSKYQSEPEHVTRIVFDLISLPEYKVSLSEDKRQIKVSFSMNYVESLDFSSDGTEDKIVISAADKLNYDIYQNVDPNNVVIDLFGVVSHLNSNYAASGRFVTGINVSKTDSSLQIVVNTNDLTGFRASADGKSLTVTVKESTLKNISYSKASNSIILKNPEGISSGSFGKTDKYTERQYIISFNDDYERIYGYGELSVHDSDGVKSFKIERGPNGNTQIVITENAIMEFLISSEGDTLRIKGVNPKEVYDKVIVIDPGHGKQDPGASGNGIIEKNANLAVVKHLNSYLETDSRFKVYATRLDDSYPANKDRAKMGNEIGDIFISVHMNSAANPEGKGSEVLYLTHSNESEFSGKVTSMKLATEIQKNLISYLGTENRGIKSRPDLIVLNSTKVPAVLVEVGFLSNEEDAAVIASENGKKEAARAIYDALVSLVGQYSVR